jgi:hypothetical protein
MVIRSVHIPAAATTHEVCAENAATTNVNSKQWPGKMKVWIIVSRWHSDSSPEGKEGHYAVRRKLCGRRRWYQRSSKQKNQAAFADTASLVLETFGSLTTELPPLITVIFFPSYTFNPSLPPNWADSVTKCWKDGCSFTNDSRAMCLRHFRPYGARSIFSTEAPEWVNTAHLSFYHSTAPRSVYPTPTANKRSFGRAPTSNQCFIIWSRNILVSWTLRCHHCFHKASS